MNTNILGKQVLPLPIKKGLITGREADKSNGDAGAWLTGDKAVEYYNKIGKEARAEYDEDSIRMKWYIFAICADGTYTLRSDLGYERSGVEIDEFEIIKNGEEW